MTAEKGDLAATSPQEASASEELTGDACKDGDKSSEEEEAVSANDVPGGPVRLPQKRMYRQRAHCNPWSDHSFDYPVRPDAFDWSALYGGDSDHPVTIVDVGCGYGGLLFQLATTFPESRSLGMEIRLKVVDYVQSKITALRQNHPGSYQNIACIRTNAMKYLPNYIKKGQLEKMFFLYPDPHFKRHKHKWRIISCALLTMYAYLMKPGGRLYTVTDVPDLADWMASKLRAHPLFLERHHLVLPSPTQTTASWDSAVAVAAEADPAVALLCSGCSEEAKKATREGRGATVSVFKRLPNPD
ncbi:tRNA (guanine-N(7)-)-methyltransferase [Sparganum proliferum]